MLFHVSVGGILYAMQLPLFPLPNLVLLPGMVVPLHIFEPRYRELLARVKDTEEPFGMLHMSPLEDGLEGMARMSTIGSLAHLIRSETHEDGTSTILILGGERFKVLEFDETRYSYLSAEVEMLPLEQTDPEDATVRGADVFERFAQNFPPDVQVMLRENQPADTLLQASFVAGNMQLQGDQMQQVLEASDLSERWRVLERFLPDPNDWQPPADRMLN